MPAPEFGYGILRDLDSLGAVMDKVVLHVEGMKCGGCESSVKNSLEAKDGIGEVRADHQLNQVEVDFDPSLISIDQVKETITAKGYTVTG